MRWQLGWRICNKGRTSDQVREQTRAIVLSFPAYDANSVYYDQVFEAVHERAFDQAYKMGGRRRSSSFDEDRYVTMLIGMMHQKATEDGRTEIAEHLEQHRQALGLPVVEMNSLADSPVSQKRVVEKDVRP